MKERIYVILFALTILGIVLCARVLIREYYPVITLSAAVILVFLIAWTKLQTTAHDPLKPRVLGK